MAILSSAPMRFGPRYPLAASYPRSASLPLDRLCPGVVITHGPRLWRGLGSDCRLFSAAIVEFHDHASDGCAVSTLPSILLAIVIGRDPGTRA